MTKGSTNHPPFTAGQLESLSKALGHTDDGLSGTEIGHFLTTAKIEDTDPEITKWKRLYNALVKAQNRDQHATRVLNFIHHAMAPARYVGKSLIFEQRRSLINVTLAFIGLEFNQDGRFHHVAAATTLKEAEERANRLRAKLQARGVHADVLLFCRAELLQDNYFHAVLEATKSVAEKIRQCSGCSSDGSDLVDQALAGANPLLHLNPLSNSSEKSEQSGFVNLLKGLFGVFRNPTAHAPKVAWPMPEEDALDLLSIASYAHRRMDRATKRP